MSTAMAFRPAARERVPLKLAITGPSGSGKTYGALLLAFGLIGESGRVAVIDTENGSADLYAHLGAFDVLRLEPPFTHTKYIEAISAAAKAHYDVLIIDSLSHAWAGEGGLLQQKEMKDARGGNSYTNWAEITKFHEQMKGALLNSPMHVIATMRSKQDYVLETNSRGKQEPRKIGLAPIQRDGMEYEFTVVLDCAMNHEAAASKDRTGLFDGTIAKISTDTGAKLRAWLESGAEPKPQPAPAPAPELELQPPLPAEGTEVYVVLKINERPDRGDSVLICEGMHALIVQGQFMLPDGADLPCIVQATGTEQPLRNGLHPHTISSYKLLQATFGDKYQEVSVG